MLTFSNASVPKQIVVSAGDTDASGYAKGTKETAAMELVSGGQTPFLFMERYSVDWVMPFTKFVVVLLAGLISVQNNPSVEYCQFCTNPLFPERVRVSPAICPVHRVETAGSIFPPIVFSSTAIVATLLLSGRQTVPFSTTTL